MPPLTPDEILKRHAQFERECVEQAKRELGNQPTSGIAYIKQLITRAQQIKEERKRNGQSET